MKLIEIKLSLVLLFSLTQTTLHSQTVTDMDGNDYKTVTIGKQTWMAENLKTTKFNDSTAIMTATDSINWTNLTTPAYCWYNNDDTAYKNIYGALYNWYTVNTGKLCPSGWHVPDASEWTTLIDFLKEREEMKTSVWSDKSNELSYIRGFAALPGGGRFRNGIFVTLGHCSYWWSSTESNFGARFVGYYDDGIERGNYEKQFGLSIRCVRD